jgi:hypothetical protein
MEWWVFEVVSSDMGWAGGTVLETAFP